MITAQVYRVSGENILRCAAWYPDSHAVNASSPNSHGDTNREFLNELIEGEWVTVRGFFSILDNVSSVFNYFFYGSEGSVGTFYLDNVFLMSL